MAPKRKAPTSSGAQQKKQQHVPTLEEKLAMLDLLRDGMSIANVARKYDCNESSIHAIKIQEREIHQAVASTPGFKAAKDRVTVLLCGNAAGHLIKPSLLYRDANPRVLKGKNKNLLPVFWQSNKKA
uniref:HTH psq-type domain-containing protein n=1 Tax=Chelonoidis abingdonii TaxID=106734 RepID=A0A8C0HGK6_CHEAB